MVHPSNKVTVIEIMSNNLENILKKEVNSKVRNTIFQLLLEHLKNDKLSHGAISAATTKFNVQCSTVSRLCKQAEMSNINDDEIFIVS